MLSLHQFTFLDFCSAHSDRLVRACAELPKLCEFFHIPFQSGDNDVLREMKVRPLDWICLASHALAPLFQSLHLPSILQRGYTHQRYRAIVDNIRRYMPDASISGDAIVGFPGEVPIKFLL